MVTRFIALLALVSGLHAPLISRALAQYPARPVRLVVPAAPGGGTDIVTRSVVPALSENLGQTVVIENRGGAGGVIGSDLVAKATPDGYTLLMVYVSHATNPTLNKTLPYDTLRVTMSVPPPGAAGTTRRIGLAGYCASAGEMSGAWSPETSASSAMNRVTILEFNR